MLNVIKNGNNTILIVISIRMDQILAKAQKIHNANNLHIILNRYYEIEVINDVDVGAYAALEEVIEGMQIEKKPINPTHLFFSFIYDTRFKTIQWIVFDERGTYHWILKNEIPKNKVLSFDTSRFQEVGVLFLLNITELLPGMSMHTHSESAGLLHYV